MYKHLKIKNLSVLFFSLFIIFLSCDGRERKYKTNAEVLKENKLFDSFSKQIEYIPKHDTKIFTDTILSTGFHVKMKYYSLNNNNSTKIIKASNNINKTLHFKNFEAQFQISKNNNSIAQININKKLFRKFESPTFWKKAIMQFVWIDFENSSENFIVLNTSFNIPETEIYKDFSVIIDAYGNIALRATNLFENVL